MNDLFYLSNKTKKLDADQSLVIAKDAVVWFSVLVRGRLSGDADMETEARTKLRKTGFVVLYTDINPLFAGCLPEKEKGLIDE